MRPPLHLVGLVEVDGELFSGRCGLERPGAVVGADGVGEGALFVHASQLLFVRSLNSIVLSTYIDDRFLTLDASLERRLGDLDV